MRCGYALRIYAISIYVIIQTLIHLTFVLILYQVVWCKALPRPTQEVAMFAYMAFFHKNECLNLDYMKFPPNYSSPPVNHFAKMYDDEQPWWQKSYKPLFPDLSNKKKPKSNPKPLIKVEEILKQNAPKYRTYEEIQKEMEKKSATAKIFQDFPDSNLKFPAIPDNVLKFPIFTERIMNIPRIADVDKGGFPDAIKIPILPTSGHALDNPLKDRFREKRRAREHVPLKNAVDVFPIYEMDVAPLPNMIKAKNLPVEKEYTPFDDDFELEMQFRASSTAAPKESITIWWPKRAKSLAQNYKFIITYITLDVLWCIATMILMCAACIRIRGLFAILFYMPWILVTAAIIIVDCIATGYYAMAIAKTSSWFSFLAFMGVHNMDDVKDSTKIYFPDYDNYGTPAFCATLFCIRFVVFWCLNIYFLYLIYHIFRVVIHQKTVKKTMYYPPPGPCQCSSNVMSNINLCPSMSMLPMTSLCPIPSNSAHSIQSMQSNCSAAPVANPRQQKGLLDYLLDCC